MQAVLHAIQSPRRRDILRLVWDTERAAGDIASHFDVSWAAVSQHLRVLHDAGLVHQRRDGTRRLYRAEPAAFGALVPVLEQMWRTDLSRLKEVVEAEAAATTAQTDTDPEQDPR